MPIPIEQRERLQQPEVTGIMMPDTNIVDLPHPAVIWGTFDYTLFERNRQKLLSLPNRSLTPNQLGLQRLLQGKSYERVKDFLKQSSSWTEVRGNVLQGLSITDHPDLATRLFPDEFSAELKKQFQKGNGNFVLFGTQHSILHPTHEVLREESKDPHPNVAEIVIDQHIDTVINPGTRIITSGNLYNDLSWRGLVIPVFLGPDRKLIDKYIKQGEVARMRRMLLADITTSHDREIDESIAAFFEKLGEWGITHITHSVDLDVIPAEDRVFSVRYSPIMPYLGLGCQTLPDRVQPADLDALRRLRYPNPQVRYHLENQQRALNAQDPEAVRAKNQELRSYNATNPLAFATDAIPTNLGSGTGLRLNKVVQLIGKIKNAASRHGIQDGIPLRTGGTYKGSVVEMCGFEDQEKSTSRAAKRISQAIAV